MIEFDVTKTLDQFNKLASSATFFISESANDVAFRYSRKTLSEQMRRDLITRNKQFSSPKAFKVKKSKKNDLKVSVYHAKAGLGLQQKGGVELPKNKKIAVPNRVTMAMARGLAAVLNTSSKFSEGILTATMMKTVRKPITMIQPVASMKPIPYSVFFDFLCFA